MTFIRCIKKYQLNAKGFEWYIRTYVDPKNYSVLFNHVTTISDAIVEETVQKFREFKTKTTNTSKQSSQAQEAVLSTRGIDSNNREIIYSGLGQIISVFNNHLVISLNNDGASIPIGDLNKCDIFEDGYSASGSWLGRAIAGDLLYGSTGALIGVLTRKDKKMIRSVSVRVYASNLPQGYISIPLNLSELEINSPSYNNIKQDALKIYNRVNALITNKGGAENKTICNQPGNDIKESVSFKLKQIKELLDDDLITHDEYNTLRQKILKEMTEKN